MNVLDQTADKIQSLAKHLELDAIDIADIDASSYRDHYYEYGNQEWIVVTQEEADSLAYDYIMDSVWAFNAEFLSSHIPALSVEQIEGLRGDSCEDCNDAFAALLDDKGSFVDDAIGCDGIGHFLSGYDGNEIELGNNFLAYRVN